MRVLLALILSLSSLSAWSINYFRCEDKSDCVRAYGGCGRYLSVHRRYKELYEAKAHKADRVANCLPMSDSDKQRKFEGKLYCLKSSCRLLVPKKKIFNSDQSR